MGVREGMGRGVCGDLHVQAGDSACELNLGLDASYITRDRHGP